MVRKMGLDKVKYVWLVMVRERWVSYVYSAHETEEGAKEAKKKAIATLAVLPHKYDEIYITRWRVEK